MRRDCWRQTLSVVFGVAASFSLAFWAGTAVLAQIPAGVDQLQGVGLQSRTLIAPADRTQALGAMAEIPAGASRHVIIQLDRIPTATERQTLADAGISLLQYIQNQGWYASVSGGLDLSAPLLARVQGSWSIETADRLAPTLQQGNVPVHAVAEDGSYVLTVLAFDDADLNVLQAEIEALGGQVYSVSAAFNTLFLHVPPEALRQIADLDEIQWIEPLAPVPVPEMNRARAYLGTDLVQASPYGLTGTGVVVSVHDSAHAFRHLDYSARWTQGDASAGQSLVTGLHPSMTAGTIAGDGTATSTYKGMAPAASIVTYSYYMATNCCESNNYADIVLALQSGVDIANNSWGYGGCHDLPYGDYTSQARVFDREVLGLNSTGTSVGSPTVVVFSAGNERYGYGSPRQTDCITNITAPYANYRTINQPKSAKNVIVVGAVDSANDLMSAFSSWGPTTDGRLKPDIVAAGLHNGTVTWGVSDITNPFGSPIGASNQQDYRTTSDTNVNSSGTSYDDRYAWFSQTSAASALVSGNAALFLEDFRAHNAGANPLPSTVKAHFIHTARDLDDSTSWYNPGPDYASGYGVLSMQAAIDQLRAPGKWLEACVAQGETDTYDVSIPSGATQAKFTLVWDDAPGAPGTTAPALVNDLDLVVTDASGVRRYPWTLNPAVPSAAAVRTVEDHLNNVEMVLADGTVPSGVWHVNVKGTSVPSGPQCYSLVSSAALTSQTQLPDLIVSALTGPSSVVPGSSITVADTTKNQGPGSAAASTTKFFWSTDTTFDAADVALGARSVAALAAGASSGLVSTVVTVPAGAGTGTYYVLAVADAANAVSETSETNNTKYLTVRIGPDLIVSALTGPSAAAPGSAITISDTTKNQGGAAAGASVTRFVWSTDSKYDTTDLVLGSRAVGTLAAGASSGPVSTTVTVPSGLATGTYYVIAAADSGGAVTETSETNNTKYLSVKIGPDLVISVLKAPSTVAPGSSIEIQDTTENQGLVGTAVASVTRLAWSVNTTYDAEDPVLASHSVPGLAAKGAATTITPVRVPAGATTGTYYIIAVADSGAAVTETSETNNTKYVAVKVGPDLIVSALTGPSTAAPGGSITVSDTTTNQGLVSAAASVTKFVWSANTTYDAADPVLGSRAIGALAAGASSGPVGTTVTVPGVLAGGTYYVIAVADSGSANAETSETNNTKYLAVKVGPDLIVSALTGPATVAPGSAVPITETTTNQGTNVADPSDTKYFWSTNTTYDAGDLPLGGHALPAVAAGSSYGPVSMNVTAPSGLAAGTYYILAVADATSKVTETVETNNTKSLAVKIGPDLIVSALTGPSTAAPSATITVSDTTTNQGLVPSVASVTKFVWSTNTTYDATDPVLASRAVPALVAGASSGPSSVLVIVPAGLAGGTYYVVAVADSGQANAETSETNNTKYWAVKVGADLVVSAFSGPSTAAPGESITVTDVTTNPGTAPAGSSVTRFVWSANTTYDTSDTALGSRNVVALAAGASSGPVSTKVTVPTGLAAGTYYIIAVADADGAVTEASETNNTKYVAVKVGPDLIVSSFTGPTTLSPGHSYTYSETTQNQGAVTAGASWTTIYVSRDRVYDSSDTLLLQRSVPSLAGGVASGPVSHTYALPAGALPGTYYLIAVADAAHAVTETSETNNTKYLQITITP